MYKNAHAHICTHGERRAGRSTARNSSQMCILLPSPAAAPVRNSLRSSRYVRSAALAHRNPGGRAQQNRKPALSKP